MHYAGKHAYVQAGMHICRQACIDASSSYKQACFYAILKGMHSCGQACIYAGTHANMQAGIHICRQACTYAGRSYEQACFYAILVRMHACMQAVCIYAGKHAYMQAGMHICRIAQRNTNPCSSCKNKEKKIASIPTGKNAIENGLIKTCNGMLWFSNKRATEWGVTDADVGIYIHTYRQSVYIYNVCIYLYICVNTIIYMCVYTYTYIYIYK